MAITATKQGGGDFQIPAPGQYLAVCHRVIDCGTHNIEFNGKPKKQRKVKLMFELAGENLTGEGTAIMDDGKPFVVGRSFTLSLSDNSHLRPFLEGWRGRPFTEEEDASFDIEQLLGVPCLLTIVHEKSKDGKRTYANIKTAGRIMKGMEKPAPINEVFSFSLEDFDQKKFEKLSDKMREYIGMSDEFKTLNGMAIDKAVSQVNSTEPAPFDDDIPF